jgi:hypothetical protein
MKNILDNKGKLIGRELDNGNMLDSQGRLTARFIAGSNMTVNGKGENKGQGDQRLRLLGDK